MHQRYAKMFKRMCSKLEVYASYRHRWDLRAGSYTRCSARESRLDSLACSAANRDGRNRTTRRAYTLCRARWAAKLSTLQDLVSYLRHIESWRRGQTKRILWIVPNFRAVNAGVKLPPQSVKEKFKTGALDSFDYSSFIFVGIQAGISQATDAYPGFRQGAAGYGRYYWHTFADQTDENLWVEGILPSVLRQDSRYYTLGHGGFIKRGYYAVSRTLITRTDSGRETFNASEILGSGTAAAISSLYYPTQYRTWTKVGQRWLTNALLDFGTFAAKEFWPDVNRAIFHETD